MALAAKNKKTSQGFTVIEMITVIVIIAILAVMGIVVYRGVVDRANDTAAIAEADSVGKQIATFLAGRSYPDYVWQIENLRVNTKAYNLKDHNNGGICLDKANKRWAFIILSKSGKAFVQQSNDGATKSGFPWNDDITSACKSVFGGGTYEVAWAWQGNGGFHWENWVTTTS